MTHPSADDAPDAARGSLRASTCRVQVETMPSVMANFPQTEITTVPVTDLEPARLVLAWRRDDPDPIVTRFVDSSRAAL